MKKFGLVVLLTTLPLGACTSKNAEETAVNVEERKQQSVAVIKSFASTLKGELQAAMKEGGPVNAISVCNTVAPAIAAQKSQETGWDVGRTSLKLRNPDNAPDSWEQAVLEAFNERRAAGEDPQTIAFAEVVEQDGGKVFRFMKAIPTGQVCLNCHGENIAEPVKAKLDELYPQDRARGYKQGEIRGAFTITQPL